MSLTCATPWSVISRNSAGTSIFGISYFGRPNESLRCFAVLALVASVVVSFMTLILKGRFWLDLPTPPSTPDVGREAFQFGPRSNLDSIVPFVGRMIPLTHSSRLEKGPEERSPSSCSDARERALMAP